MKKLLLLLLLLFPICAQAQFFKDLCTGTDATALTSHSPDIGSTWTQPHGTSVVILSNTCDVNSSTSTTWQEAINAAVPYNANYYVQGTFSAGNASNGNNELGVDSRAVSTTFYNCELLGAASNSKLRVQRVVNDANTELAFYTANWAASTNYIIRLDVWTNPAGNVELRCYLDNVLRISYTDSNAAKITVTGKPGFFLTQGATPNIHSTVDTLIADGIRTRRVY